MADHKALPQASEPMIIIEPVREIAYSFTILQTLQEFKPKHVIMYDIDMTFVRQMEVCLFCSLLSCNFLFSFDNCIYFRSIKPQILILMLRFTLWYTKALRKSRGI